MNIGAGRIVYPDFSRVEQSIQDKSFHENGELCRAIVVVHQGEHVLHIMGLLSPGGVHSH